MDIIWFLFLLPLAGAVLNYVCFFKRGGVASILSTGAVLGTFALTVYLLQGGGALGKAEGFSSVEWIQLGEFRLSFGVLWDDLSSKMMVIVTGIGLLVHVFSLVYMKEDEAKARYFTSLSFFMFSMTGIVLSTNFIMMFVFWELVGLSSYLLIGHWYHKSSAADAAKKAFLTNRIGDFGFILGILMLWKLSGHVSFEHLEAWARSHPEVSSGLLGAVVLLIFCGAIGKSAQLPLHVWLPDAMEGPTPVSALIHAATMVAAGVFMMVRFLLCLEGVDGGGGHGEAHALTEGGGLVPEWALQTIAWVGAVTSLLAALMATQQDDLKKILAYSTLSQLGYMIMAVGCSGGDAAMFHLYTHAWFKALLFLGAGAIIYACHHEQNIWKMGGLFKKMPVTSLTFLFGTAALIAVPMTSGFFSKEQILVVARKESPWLFYMTAGVAVLTAFYMVRLFLVVFFGASRSRDAEKAEEVPGLMKLPLVILSLLALVSGFSFVAKRLAPNFHEHAVDFGSVEFIVSVASLLIGGLSSFLIYRGRESDPLSGSVVTRCFKRRFYLDECYEKIVFIGQDLFAAIIHFWDEFLINGLIIGGVTRVTGRLGGVVRKLQSGNLQIIMVVLALGVLGVIYLTTFLNR